MGGDSKHRGSISGEAPAPFEISLKHFEILGIIGEGAFGKVKRIERKKGGPKGIYALKYIDKKKCIEKHATYNMFRERIVLQKLKHPFIVNLKYAFQDDANLFMVLDLAEGGDLRCHLERLKGVKDENLIVYAAEISCALNYLHQNKIIHRDLKPENILLDRDGHLLLTDFNVCADLEVSQPSSPSGTRPYMAPEMFLGENYAYSVDWWATGIILYECCYGKRPYKVDREWKKKDFIENPWAFLDKFYKTDVVIPKNLDRECLIKGLLEISISKRLGSSNDGYGFEADIMPHPFFASVKWEGVEKKELTPSYKPNLKVLNIDSTLLIDEIIGGGDGLAYKPRKAPGSKRKKSISSKIASGIKKMLGISKPPEDPNAPPPVLSREEIEMREMDLHYTTFNFELPNQVPMKMPVKKHDSPDLEIEEQSVADSSAVGSQRSEASIGKNSIKMEQPIKEEAEMDLSQRSLRKEPSNSQLAAQKRLYKSQEGLNGNSTDVASSPVRSPLAVAPVIKNEEQENHAKEEHKEQTKPAEPQQEESGHVEAKEPIVVQEQAKPPVQESANGGNEETKAHMTDAKEDATSEPLIDREPARSSITGAKIAEIQDVPKGEFVLQKSDSASRVIPRTEAADNQSIATREMSLVANAEVAAEVLENPPQ